MSVERKPHLISRVIAKPFRWRYFVNDRPRLEMPTIFAEAYPGRLQSLGDANPELLFYVIWRARGGSGFFSNLAHVLAHLAIAERLGAIPVVDFQHFPTLYSESEPILGTRNAWEYYFLPVSPSHDLGDVYASRRVFFCDGEFPPRITTRLSRIPDAGRMLERHVRVRPDVVAEVDGWADRLFGVRTLGIHFRGQELNRATGHPFGPTEAQMLAAARTLDREHHFDRIFVVSEDQRYVDLIRDQLGERVVATESYRTRGANAYLMSPRPQHRYLLGREVLIDGLLLSRCDVLLSGESNVSEFARLAGETHLQKAWRIDNGHNSDDPVVAMFAHAVRKRLPPGLGGFRGTLVDD